MSDYPHTTIDYNEARRIGEFHAQRGRDRWDRQRCTESETGKHSPTVTDQEVGRTFLHLTLTCSVCGREMSQSLPLYQLEWHP